MVFVVPNSSTQTPAVLLANHEAAMACSSTVGDGALVVDGSGEEAVLLPDDVELLLDTGDVDGEAEEDEADDAVVVGSRAVRSAGSERNESVPAAVFVPPKETSSPFCCSKLGAAPRMMLSLIVTIWGI
ncbi:hypothetical protein AA15669_1415 [Saccharibacter floricola DSM 15669]|uniref:Uncharacterized protein n=1 Tax=Saccharibacter floricola DSM 15669 TaxID=1123227 RepID=A0ABQ0P077_9PROT|nr:hypothetical protein AA15669_1415 [Saccharibacter floricola DSM 15669]